VVSDTSVDADDSTSDTTIADEETPEAVDETAVESKGVNPVAVVVIILVIAAAGAGIVIFRKRA